MSDDEYGCPAHPQSCVWMRKIDGIGIDVNISTCAICGTPLRPSVRAKLADVPPEPTTIRSFALYRDNAARTDVSSLDIQGCAMGISGEAGELIDALKKMLYHKHPADREKFINEAGDLMWYLDRLAQRLGFSLEEAATANAAKLKKRYERGFSPEASIARVDVEAAE